MRPYIRPSCETIDFSPLIEKLKELPLEPAVKELIVKMLDTISAHQELAWSLAREIDELRLKNAQLMAKYLQGD